MGNCPRCGFKKWIKSKKINEDGISYWRCGRCGSEQLGDYPFIRLPKKELYLDVETSLTDIYGNFGTRVRGEWIDAEMIKRPYFIICWSALWTDKPNKVYSGCVTQEDALRYNDKNILAPLWDLLNAADIKAGHNVRAFDEKTINTRFIVNGFGEPLESKSIDTLSIAKKKYKFERNTLDYLCTVFGIPNKVEMKRADWIAIKETGDPKTLRKMLRYNRGDVRNGAALLKILRGNLSPDFGSRTFAKNPKDLRIEKAGELEQIQESLDNIEYLIGEK